MPDEGLAESDAFWDYWSDFPHPEVVRNATSLEQNAAFAHLILRGHITDLYIGEHWQMAEGEAGVAIVYAKVAVGEVLKGEPVWRSPGFVEVALGTVSEETVNNLLTELPQHDNVWFLMHEITIRPRQPANETEIAPFAYYPTNDLQGVFRNIDGLVRVIKPEWTTDDLNEILGPTHFPIPFQGADFDEFVQQVRHVITQAAPTPL